MFYEILNEILYNFIVFYLISLVEIDVLLFVFLFFY